MKGFSWASITLFLSALLIAPAITYAAGGAAMEEQPTVAPVTQDATLMERCMTTATSEATAEQAEAASEVPVPALAPTPKAAIDWNQKETDRRAARDRAEAMRQQTIINESQALPAR